MLIAASLVAQDWDHSEWQEYKLYKDGELIDWGSRYWQDVKCFDGDCYALSFNLLFSPEVFRLDKQNNKWDMVFDGNWDPFNTPEKDWPEIIYPTHTGIILTDSSVLISYNNTFMINKLNWKHNTNDTMELPSVDRPDFIDFHKNGMGIMSTGSYAYYTFDNWNTIESHHFTFPASDLLAPTVISNDKFYVADYDNGDGYIMISSDGKIWDRYFVGEFHVFDIHFIDENIGFLVGSRFKEGNDTSDDVIYKTSDGGFTWNKVLDQYNEPGSWGLYGISFINDSIGIATSKTAMLYTTTNQGESWDYVEMAQLEKDIYTASVEALGERVFLLNNNITNMYIYDATLLGITSVPFFKYKELIASPNPFVNSINIPSDAVTTGEYKIKIYDVNSELVYEDVRFISGELKLNLELSTGAYFLLLEGEDYYYKKIIRE